jgi:hypothetical protein
MNTKELNYAYPSSTIAKQQGFSKDGCYFVTTGDPEGDYSERKIVFASKDREPCIEAMDKIALPLGGYSLPTES